MNEMEYQEKILYMFILNTHRLLLEILSDNIFDNHISMESKNMINEINLLIEQRIKELKNE